MSDSGSIVLSRFFFKSSDKGTALFAGGMGRVQNEILVFHPSLLTYSYSIVSAAENLKNAAGM